eukprot:Skav212261  [mRNA]  locus=scaffold732:39561:41024:- [translate_table: standard]
MAIMWKDLRWQNASQRLVQETCRLKSCTSEELLEAHASAADELEGYVFGQSAEAFFEATRVYGAYLGMVVSGNVWTPIPADLFLKTSTNPLGKTDSDPIIFMPYPDVIQGFWADSRTTNFDVVLSYEHFPFDEQVLDLCVSFDYFTVPLFHPFSDGSASTNLEQLAERWDGPSELSELVSSKFLAALERKGFSVVSIQIDTRSGGLVGSKICIEIVVVRLVSILLLRFFLPLSFLLFIPFAGFFIPIEMVMPRVATGFISFLSLQVFRTMAYTLIPKKSSSLLWMDVAMFSVTLIMFMSLLENVLAQAVRANISIQFACFVDNLSRAAFPLLALVILIVLFGLGAARVDPAILMAICLTLLSCWLLAFGIAVWRYSRTLPQRLMKRVVSLVSHQATRYTAAPLGPRELLLVFKVFDPEGTKKVTAEMILKELYAHGLSLDESQQKFFEAKLHETVEAFSGDAKALDLRRFCQHFEEVFHDEPGWRPS